MASLTIKKRLEGTGEGVGTEISWGGICGFGVGMANATRGSQEILGEDWVERNNFAGSEIKMSKREKWILIITFLTPSLAFYLLFVIYPMLRAFYVSLFYWRGVSPKMTFVGLENLKRLLFQDPVFWLAFKHNLYFLVVAGSLTLIISLFLAAVLSKKIKGAQFYKTVYFFPNVISIVAISVLWSFIYHPTFGILSSFLKLIGLENLSRGWLGDPQTALPALIVPVVWYSIGFYMVLFIAGIQNIPESLYDAAKIDGVSEWQNFWHITLPLIWELLKTAVVFIVIHCLNIFALVFLMTAGGPSRHTEVLATYLYEKAFKDSEFGYATALGVILFIFIFSASLISMRLMRKPAVEY